MRYIILNRNIVIYRIVFITNECNINYSDYYSQYFIAFTSASQASRRHEKPRELGATQ